MSALPPALIGSLRPLRLGAILSSFGALLLHCRWVLLNGVSTPYRLWTVLVGAFPPFLWTFLFKQAKHIPVEIRPPIHIDLLPKLNQLLLSPGGVLLVTLSLVPLARLVYFWARAFVRCSSQEKRELTSLCCDANLITGHGDKDTPERGRGRVYAASIMLFPLALWFTDLLGKAEPTNLLDLLAFGSYGALHFASPIIAGWWIWGFGCQGAACTFGWALGAQNLAGLATHLVFPNAAPWFYDVYGIDAAQPDYSYPGNPAGLIRVDTILGTHIYAKAFKWGAVVFGAVPSLHAATSICCGLFATRYSKGYRGLAFMWIYCFWMFWATQYLHHHVSFYAIGLAAVRYQLKAHLHLLFAFVSPAFPVLPLIQFAIDLLCGTGYSVISFLIFERVRLRRLDRTHYTDGLTNGWERLRWSIRDGDNWTEYGARQLARLSGKEGVQLSCGEGASLSRSSSGGSFRRDNVRNAPAGAGRNGGYSAVPSAEARESEAMARKAAEAV
ncbi:SPOSA6832_04048, partial [Sporobolomyces salmonicolor]